MKAAIRYTIIALIAAAIAVILGKAGVTHTDEKEIRWIPFILMILLLMQGGKWLDIYLRKQIGK